VAATGKQLGLCAILIVALVIGAIFWLRNSNRVPLSQREVAMRVLGEQLKKTLRPAKVLLISNPYSQMSGRPAEVYSFQSASEAGLRKGLGASVEVKIAFPKLKPEAIKDPGSIYIDRRSSTPLSFMITESAFDELLKENPDYEVAVSLIGLPLDVGAREFWKKSTPRFGLLLPDLRVIGNVEDVRRAFASGKIAAAVVARPGVAAQKMGADYKAEFEKRFVLVTAENVEAMMPLLLP
jgi:hypothetical protein